MDTDESTTTTDLATTITPTLTNLCRVGSGASLILDSENGIEAESRKLPSSRFKGVVPQPNGRWGSQIYEKHQRVWLGTFNEEEEAAKAYDTAAQRFRGHDAFTNFKMEVNQDTQLESEFLNSHSKSEIVDMLRKHTYCNELEQNKKRNSGSNALFKYNSGNDGETLLLSTDQFASGRVNIREQLFEKTVTPSDVGKLNRLVIPKQQAEKHFPLQNGNSTSGTSFTSSASKGVLLNFEDNGRKAWRFRYSYWNSSQSYVLTKGWSRFVKEKNLKAGDIVSFHRSVEPDNTTPQLFIDWKVRNVNGSVISEPVSKVKPLQVVRLFGVNIFEVSICGVVDSVRRNREMELFGLDSSKKRRIV